MALMNLYTVCKPRAFTLGAPTEDNAAKSREEAPKPRPEAPGWFDFDEGIRDQILANAAITLTGSLLRNFDFIEGPPEGVTTDRVEWKARGLNWLSVECRCTWIFKRKRKSIEDCTRTGELEVTIKREVLPKQRSVYWNKMTEEEQNACSRKLMYEKTWSNVDSIIMQLHSQADETYRFQFFCDNDEHSTQDLDAPLWATWSLTQCADVRTAFETELFLNYTEEVGTTYNHLHEYQIVHYMRYDRFDI
jgi:hypothetical protein